ncbi:MAG TPA: ABC transporter substrate-binding protein [Ktedonobacterales bacterium]|nr:ABC transporter substrate-binding protein [Ktedonobacterales bacterium]
MLPVLLKKRGHGTSLASLLLGSMIVFALLLAACNSSSAPSAAPTPITPGVLTVGSDTTYPPQEYIDPKANKAAGFDVDLITAIAQHMGLQAHIVTTRFDTILDDLVAKHFDVVISAVSITPERQQQVDFTPYLTAGESLLVQEGNPKHIASTDDLCGLSVGVQSGTLEQGVLQSSSDNCQEQDKPAITIIALQDQTAVIQLLAQNRVAATYQDSPVTDYYVQQHPNQFAVGSSVVFSGPEGIAVRKDDASMLSAIQTAYNQVKAAGTYHQLILKWGLTNEELTAIDRRLNYA